MSDHLNDSRSFGLAIAGVCLLVSLAGVRAMTQTSPQTPAAERFSRFRTTDQGLRKLATHSPAPVYPRASLAKKVTGVAVAAITIDTSGRTESVDILESPDADCGRAVRDAVTQWVFKSPGRPIEGTLIFYFHLRGPQGMVSSADEMKALNSTGPPGASDEAEAAVKEIDEAAFDAIREKPGPLVLDIRERAQYLRDHRKGAVNIPLKELLARARIELPSSRHIVIDCFVQDYQSNGCAVGAHFLTSSGLTQVSLLRRR